MQVYFPIIAGVSAVHVVDGPLRVRLVGNNPELTAGDLRALLASLGEPRPEQRVEGLQRAGQRLHEIVLGGMSEDYDAMTDALSEWRKATGL
jgi:hypothetical protein